MVLAIGCTSEQKIDDNVLAKINDLEVTEDHFKSAFLRYYYKSGQSLQPSHSIKSDVLNTEFNIYVLATHAKELGLHDTDQAMRQKEMIRRKVLNEEYRDREIFKEVQVSDEELRSMYVKLNTQLRAAHLYAATKSKADSLYTELERGKSFEELAKNVFQNPQLAQSGGDLGLFGVDEMDVAFEQTAYALNEGEYSKPVRTAQGYSIIKLKEKISKPVLTEYDFTTKKNQIRYMAEFQEQEMVSRNHMFEFIDQLDINEGLLSTLWEKIRNNSASFQGLDLEFLNTINNKEKLASTSGFSLVTGDFISEIKFTPSSNLNRIQSKESLKNFITGIAYRKYMIEDALDQGIDEIPEVQASIDQSYYVYLAQQAEDEIRRGIEVTESEIRNVYFENPKKYMSPLQINTARIVVPTEEKANQIVEQARNGTSFSNLVKMHTIRNEERLYDGILGYQNIQQFGFMSRSLATLKEGEISDPIYYQTGEYHIYKCLGRKEPSPLSYKQASKQIKTELKEKKFKKVRSEVIENVKTQHDAIVDLQKLKNITIQI